MHSYLRSIGFLNLNSIDELTKVIYYTEEAYDEKHIFESKGGRCIGEIIKYFAESVALKIVGEYDSRHHFHQEYVIPILYGEQTSTCEDVLTEKKLENDAFYGVCDDVRVGSTMIFTLQNMNEYVQLKNSDNLQEGKKNIILTALAHDGTILFPMAKSESTAAEKEASQNRRNLMRAAQEGDREAMENLTLEEFDMYSMLIKRIETEDVLSIVDTYFMPSGIECDEYSILGTITEVKKVINAYSGEEVIILQVEANEISVKICINRGDLVGEPEVGRRFKGNIWLQGHVYY